MIVEQVPALGGCLPMSGSDDEAAPAGALATTAAAAEASDAHVVTAGGLGIKMPAVDTQLASSRSQRPHSGTATPADFMSLREQRQASSQPGTPPPSVRPPTATTAAERLVSAGALAIKVPAVNTELSHTRPPGTATPPESMSLREERPPPSARG
ncbi:hypothetical protein KFE25_012994 [Diacronema lutheri]|uniref:Uncharacterized protein n=1 Tax=Diacronema lutheri TaxID=2081491 RepID=A0A8J5X9R0_DIALT|nr:hypothetical protein KFE25_012994 [Diacronema lutheri]